MNFKQLLDCVKHIALSYTAIKQTTLNSCWKKLWPNVIKNEEDELVPVTFTAKVIRKELALGRKLGTHFIQNDTNVERGLRFQLDINRCLAQYEEAYNNLTKNSKQLLITDFITISHNVNISASNIESAQ